MKSQKNRIFNWLLTGKPLTALQALRMFGCMRLAARIDELRNDDKRDIKTIMVEKNGKRYAKYIFNLDGYLSTREDRE